MLAIATTLVLVAGCSKSPQFRMANANQAYDSLNELYVLLAKAELGAYRSPSSFAGTVDSYAEVVGGFETGRLMGADRPREAASFDAAIDGCVGEVRGMAQTHRTAGIDPDAFVIRTVRSRCDAAANAVAENEVSSWLFTTAAGDL
jgi:hypothetical protein